MKLKLFLFIIAITISSPSIAGYMSNKKLPPCANTPNCVSTQAKIADKLHYVEPFEIKGDPEQAWAALKDIINRKKRMVISHESHDMLHAEATSLVFRFIDDLDFLLDKEAQFIHVRSASRIGHSDFGVNRKRIETLRMQLRNAGVIE